MTTTTTPATVKDAAAAIRKDLRAAFPGRERLKQRLRLRYAIKFALDCPMHDPAAAEPTDENLAAVLASCARPPRPEDLDAIRRNVHAYRLDPDTTGA